MLIQIRVSFLRKNFDLVLQNHLIMHSLLRGQGVLGFKKINEPESPRFFGNEVFHYFDGFNRPEGQESVIKNWLY